MTKGTGSALTKLGAFDTALLSAGIANFNLLTLSSVIPPNSDIIMPEEGYAAEGGWGERLYVVMAEARTAIRDEYAWAGVGWVQDSASKKGLFVEFEGNSEAYVRDSITDTLTGMMATRGIDMGEIHMLVEGIKCEDEPVCALVAAVYKSEPW